MRRQLDLQDYDMPSLNLNVAVGEDGGKKSYGFNTQYKTHKVEIQTLIVNGNKETVGSQVVEKNIRAEVNKLNNPEIAQKQGEAEEAEEPELSEEEGRRVDKFLRKIMPVMEKQLLEALPLYERFGLHSEKKLFKKETRLTYTLENLDSQPEFIVQQEQQQQKGLVISDISWNSSGAVIGAVYSELVHETTCSHKSMICLWGMFKRNFKPTKPETIMTNNCLSCIEFHPKKPSVFVVGNYLGEILLYDFSIGSGGSGSGSGQQKKGEQLLAKTVVDDYFHRDVISQLSWWAFRAPGKTETNYNVLSLGTDGKILLWEVPNIVLGEDAPANRVKALMKNPIKGYSILRKKQGVIIPVSALSMKQSKANKNVFIVGSEGGSILKASLQPINHYMNTEGKILLDMQQEVKFRKQVYPFLLNVPQKEFRQLKQYLEKTAKARKIDQIDSVAAIYSLKPELRMLYSNSITFAFEPLSHPISSLNFNRYGMFIANGCEGYSRLYVENRKEHLESFEEGYEWGWINEGLKIGGFIGQQFCVVDWTNGETLYSALVGEGQKWKQSASSGAIGIVSERTKIKIVELGDKLFRDSEETISLMHKRMDELS